jgi:hypothetical protein
MATTTNFGWETPDDTDLVKDGALAMRTLGNAIDTSLVDLKGGTTGQVLSKTSNTDMDFTWVTSDDANAIQNAIVDAKGDLITATAADTPARLASSGVNGNVLTVDTSTATGLKWAAPAGGGKVLQVVSATTTTSTTIATTTMTDTTITATITPTAATSKILVLVNGTHLFKRTGSAQAVAADLLRGATVIGDFFTEGGGRLEVTGGTYVEVVKQFSFNYLDSPNTTSATTYKLQANISATSGSGSSIWQYETSPSTITLLEIGA